MIHEKDPLWLLSLLILSVLLPKCSTLYWTHSLRVQCISLDLLGAVLKWLEQQNSQLFLWETKWGGAEVCALREEKVFGEPLELLGIQPNTPSQISLLPNPEEQRRGLCARVSAFCFGHRCHAGMWVRIRPGEGTPSQTRPRHGAAAAQELKSSSSCSRGRALTYFHLEDSPADKESLGYWTKWGWIFQRHITWMGCVVPDHVDSPLPSVKVFFQRGMDLSFSKNISYQSIKLLSGHPTLNRKRFSTKC